MFVSILYHIYLSLSIFLCRDISISHLSLLVYVSLSVFVMLLLEPTQSKFLGKTLGGANKCRGWIDSWENHAFLICICCSFFSEVFLVVSVFSVNVSLHPSHPIRFDFHHPFSCPSDYHVFSQTISQHIFTTHTHSTAIFTTWIGQKNIETLFFIVF